MSDSPLSDVVDEYADRNDPEVYARFLALFRVSTVGFVAVGASPEKLARGLVADGSVGAGRTTFGDGQARVLAYADPEVAWRNFGPPFNAAMSREVLLRKAVDDGTRETSLIIGKAAASWILEQPGQE